MALAARVGDDFFGAVLVDELEKEGVDCKLVRKCPGRQSSVSAVTIDRSGERMLVNFKDPSIESSTDGLPQKLPREIDGVLGDHHWEAGTEHFFRLAREAGKPAILDADRQTSMGILASATHIRFSARGLREQSGMESLPEALAWCRTQVPGWLAVTDGALACELSMTVNPATTSPLYEQPILVVDPGVHTAMISSIAVDAPGRIAVTGSHDKTIYVSGRSPMASCFKQSACRRGPVILEKYMPLP